MAFAVYHGHASVIDALSSLGASVDEPVGPERMAPLTVAAADGSVDVIKASVSAGADIDKADLAGRTPMTMATEAGQRAADEASKALGA